MSSPADRRQQESQSMIVKDVPQKGSRGNVVASRNRFGQFQRARVSPDQPGTPAQRASWANMKDLSRLWNELGQARWAAWRRLAAEVHSRPKLNQSGPLDGCQLFKKLNRVLATCGREPLLDPPPLPTSARTRSSGSRSATPGADWLSNCGFHQRQPGTRSRLWRTSWSIAGRPSTPARARMTCTPFSGSCHPPSVVRATSPNCIWRS